RGCVARRASFERAARGAAAARPRPVLLAAAVRQDDDDARVVHPEPSPARAAVEAAPHARIAAAVGDGIARAVEELVAVRDADERTSLDDVDQGEEKAHRPRS